MKDLKGLVGKTLKEAKKDYDDVRVMGVGEVPFMGTCDMVNSRLNVELSGEGFTITEEMLKIGDHEYPIKKVKEKNFDKGIIIRAWMG